MIRHIAVLGAGTMGLSVVKLFATHGYPVSVYEPNLQVRNAAGESFHQENLNVLFTSDLEKAVADADLIIECAPETVEVKRQLYRQMTAGLKPEAVVASNTSTFALQQLAEGLPYADRIVIAHFFNPAHLIPLVELVALPATRSDIIGRLAELLRNIGKTPVSLNKDIPGFIANRLQAALMREACYLLAKGIASAEQIDTAVKEGIGLRWALKGPFEIADLGGLDIWSKVTGHLFPHLSNDTDTPASIMEKAARGELGVKSGSGYYRYDNPPGAAAEMNDRLQQLLAHKTAHPSGQKENQHEEG